MGEWREPGDTAVHVRRRLSAAEQRAIGAAMDIRRTDEARRRIDRLGRLILLAPPEVLADEYGAQP